MNEKSYATMLEMPFSTANVTVKPAKKRRKRAKAVDAEAVKQELIQKVNDQPISQEPLLELEQPSEISFEQDLVENEYVEQQTAVVKPMPKAKKGKGFKISVIAVQFAVIGALIATIFLTNALNANSGINVFFKSVFGSEQVEKVDERLHQEFSPVVSMSESEYVLADGVMTINASGSVYSTCNGVITSTSVDGNGKYSVEIEHSKNFKSRLTGLDFVYGETGTKVFSNIPVGYLSGEGATMCFTSADGSIISGYQIIDNSVVWAV